MTIKLEYENVQLCCMENLFKRVLLYLLLYEFLYSQPFYKLDLITTLTSFRFRLDSGFSINTYLQRKANLYKSEMRIIFIKDHW